MFDSEASARRAANVGIAPAAFMALSCLAGVAVLLPTVTVGVRSPIVLVGLFLLAVLALFSVYLGWVIVRRQAVWASVVVLVWFVVATLGVVSRGVEFDLPTIMCVAIVAMAAVSLFGALRLASLKRKALAPSAAARTFE